jgi:tetratricopeptide (TPR) repeat protein
MKNRKNPEWINIGRMEIVIFISLALIYGSATYQRNSTWKDDLTLWSDNVKKSPGKARPYNYLGLAYHKKKLEDKAKARPYNYLGLAYHKKKLEDKAIEQFKKSISLSPFYANAHVNLGVSYFETGHTDKAIGQFKHAIQIKPKHADAHYNLGIAYGEKGMIEEAYSEMRKGMKLQK